MAFTAGSAELARANKLGNILGHLYAAHGVNMTGRTGAVAFERQAKKLGFGITGVTTGKGFPPFGTAPVSLAITATLQNPRGETAASGINIGAFEGQTLGIYMPKFVRSGADFDVFTYSGYTLGTGLTAGDFQVNLNGGAAGITLTYLDRIVFNPGEYLTVGVTGGGAARFTNTGVPLGYASPFTKAPGTGFSIEVVGVTRGTRGIAGSTSENYTVAGYTATIYFNSSTGSGHTWSVN
jgi:hypothetical protein